MHVFSSYLIKLTGRGSTHTGRDSTTDAIRQRDAIFRFSLTDNFDPRLNRVALSNRVRCVWTFRRNNAWVIKFC